MAAISSVFWILGFILSVVIAPQLRVWTWGPTMLCFALSTLAAMPAIWKGKPSRADTFIVFSAFALVAWIAVRASVSPVPELAQSDLLLTAMAVATFMAFRAGSGRTVSRRILVSGLALILAASVWVIFIQHKDPTYSPVFPNTERKWPGGFFAHYSYGASFLVPVSLILAAVALHSREHRVFRGLLGLIALSGIVAVYFANSRGGFIGIGAGLGALGLLSILAGKKHRKKWFAPAIIIFPIVLIGLAVLFLGWLGDIQESRAGSADLTGMLDNDIRFYLIGIAVSCFGLHPLVGGGSRSFSWECFGFWETEAIGRGSNKPEHVHNELLQTACEYGALGAGLLVFFAVSVAIVAVVRITSRNTAPASVFGDSWRIGGLAGFIGLFAQSNFEGIFRIPPGAILLGLCLAAACAPERAKGGAAKPWMSHSLASIAALGAFAMLAVFGWKGSMVSRILWPIYFSKARAGLETRADRLSSAIAVWPLGSLQKERGAIYQRLASEDGMGEGSAGFLDLALKDFQAAESLHRYDPEPAIRSAIVLSAMERDSEAERTFRKAVDLQGEMEAAFSSNALLARHLHGKGLRKFSSGQFLDALNTFQLATVHIERAYKLDGWRRGDDRLRVSIHESYGQILEAMGDFGKALEQYDFAATLSNGSSAHYRAGVLFGKRAVHAWSERRSSDALRLFMEAESRTHRSSELPPGVDTEKRAEYLAYLKKSIEYLKGAKVEPSEKLDF